MKPGCQMTGDKFRVRADRYIKAAGAVTDPVHKSGSAFPATARLSHANSES